MKKIRARLTFANVVAGLALFVALGGTGYAATQLPKGSVGAKQLTKGAVTTAKLKAKAVTSAKLKRGAVGTAALADGAVTGAKVNAATLGTVPSATRAATAGDATTLQGRPPGAFVQGAGQVLGNTVQLRSGDKGVPIVDVPGFGALTGECATNTKGNDVGNFEFFNSSGAKLSDTLQYPQGGTEATAVEPGQSTLIGGFELSGAWTWTFSTLTSPARILTLNLGFSSTSVEPAACVLIAQAVVSG
jgi:hypothetical protein